MGQLSKGIQICALPQHTSVSEIDHTEETDGSDPLHVRPDLHNFNVGGDVAREYEKHVFMLLGQLHWMGESSQT